MVLYDTYNAFRVALLSLERFNALVNERHQAGYVRGERLQEWVILGRYYLDSCGNTMKYFGEDIPAIIFPNLPPVMMQKEFQDYVKKNSLGKEIWCSAAMESDIPPANLICPECKTGWTIQNCHDTVVVHKTQVIKLDEYADSGTKLSDVLALWNKDNDALWLIQPDKSIRNDRYIDRSIVNSKLGLKNHWQVNERGWITADGDYLTQPSDEAMVNIWTYRHFLCHREHQARIEKQYFQDIFTDAGFKDITLAETKNQYCSCEHCAPWYVVYADKLYFLIGWRKRVISIEIDDSLIDLTRLFAAEETTKGTQNIHAWGRKKCVEYLRTIRNIVRR